MVTHTAEICHCFRQRDRWISELDHCYVTPKLLDYVRDFKIESRLDLPSDHAPISVYLSVDKLKHTAHVCSRLYDRACQLGDYTNFCYRYDRPHRQIKWHKSYMPTVMQSLSLTQPPDLYDRKSI